MAFWGVEVKPGKPYTHRYDRAHGRLRICQATLGNFNVTARSVVQCNIGNKSPVILCSLNPKLAEMCRLEIELEEEEEVVFSVLGQSGVHLSGYYLRPGGKSGGDESDSYGEDIGESDTEDLEYAANDSEDKYESDFIDDGDIEMSTPPPHKSKVVEETVKDKPAGSHRCLRKKHQISDSDDNVDVCRRQPVVKRSNSMVVDSEDEDSLPISLSLSNKNTVSTSEGTTHLSEKTNDETIKRKSNVISQDPGILRDLPGTNGSLPSEIDAEKHGTPKKKKKTKDGKSPETGTKSSADEKLNNTGDLDVLPETEIKEKDVKKKKKGAKRAKTSEMQSVSAEQTGVEAKHDSTIASNDDLEQQHPAEPEKQPNNNIQSNKKSKISKRKAVKGDSAQEKDVPQVGILDKDTNGSNRQSPEMNRVSNDDADPSALATQPEAKKKKKRAKNHEKDLNINQATANPLEAADAKQLPDMRTLDNGLIIEDLSMGKSDAKIASDGSKVSVNYIGKLQNGKVFASTVGHKPYKFRLGAGDVVKGLDLGISGMRVGDKRRLTIPPAIGYGDEALGEIPKNSWLVYDVELVNVR